MSRSIESAAARIGTAVHIAVAKIDVDMLSLPGGSLIAIALWLYTSALGSGNDRRVREKSVALGYTSDLP